MGMHLPGGQNLSFRLHHQDQNRGFESSEAVLGSCIRGSRRPEVKKGVRTRAEGGGHLNPFLPSAYPGERIPSMRVYTYPASDKVLGNSLGISVGLF
jgi:hypothetical protein